jgi:hypothetical protein
MNEGMFHRGAGARVFVIVAVTGATAAACGRQNAVLPPGGIESSRFCSALIEAACDRGARCGTAPTDRAACRALLTDTLDECPFMVEAVGRGEADYDEDGAALFVEETRSGDCAEMVPDPVALGVFTPRREEGQVCHSKVSCKAGLLCANHTVTTPEGTCGR